MSHQTVCDNDLCTEVYEAHDDVRRLWWVRLGWVESERLDACSVDCARAVLDDLQQRQWAVEQMPDEALPA